MRNEVIKRRNVKVVERNEKREGGKKKKWEDAQVKREVKVIN